MSVIDHVEALLVNDGHEFAMIRKSDLCALWHATQHDTRLDRLAELQRMIDGLDRENKDLWHANWKLKRDAFKHGGERRRYMANNKALQARVAELDEECQGYVASITDLAKNARKHGNERRAMRKELLLLRTQLSLVRSAVE